MIVNGAVETDAIIELAKNAKTSFEDLVDTISHIEVLKADKDIFPFVTNLKNGCYFENNVKQLLDDYSSDVYKRQRINVVMGSLRFLSIRT